MTHVLHGPSTSAVVGEEGDMETHQVTTIDGEEVEGTATATVSIVNPDGTETQIPVELVSTNTGCVRPTPCFLHNHSVWS